MNRKLQMLNTALWIGCACMAGMSGMARAATPEAQIRALEQKQCHSALSGDLASLQRIFAEDFELVNPAGQITTREQLLALLTGATHPYRSAICTTQKVRTLGNVVVTIDQEEVVPNTGAQAGQSVRRIVTQVWVRAHGSWRLSVRQAMVVPPA